MELIKQAKGELKLEFKDNNQFQSVHLTERTSK